MKFKCYHAHSSAGSFLYRLVSVLTDNCSEWNTEWMIMHNDREISCEREVLSLRNSRPVYSLPVCPCQLAAWRSLKIFNDLFDSKCTWKCQKWSTKNTRKLLLAFGIYIFISFHLIAWFLVCCCCPYPMRLLKVLLFYFVLAQVHGPNKI